MMVDDAGSLYIFHSAVSFHHFFQQICRTQELLLGPDQCKVFLSKVTYLHISGYIHRAHEVPKPETQSFFE